MEWTNDVVLSLIHEYQSQPALWNSNSPYFKLKSRREHAWEDIAEKLGTEVNEIKKKMNSVLASFRRERSKVLRFASDSDEPYESRWFAFDSFRFLMDKTTIKSPDDVMEPVIESAYHIQEFDCATIIKSEAEEIPEEIEIHYSPLDGDSIAQQSVANEPQNRNAEAGCRRRSNCGKRRAQHEDTRVSSLCKIVKKLNQEHEERDECKVFGEYLVFKLKHYDFHTRAVVQHLINNVIFNADIGKYSKVDSERKSTDISGNSNAANNNIAAQDYLQEISKIVTGGQHFLDT